MLGGKLERSEKGEFMGTVRDNVTYSVAQDSWARKRHPVAECGPRSKNGPPR